MRAGLGGPTLVVVIVGAVGAVGAGCLPRGEPPRGQQLVQGRLDDVVVFQPSALGDRARLLTQRVSAIPGPPNLIPGDVDVFIASDGDTGRPPPELLFPNAAGGGIPSGGPGFEADARARLFLSRAIQDQAATPSEPAPLHFERFRVDLETGARTDYGKVESFIISPDRTMALVGNESVFRLLDLDDHETVLSAAASAGFVGNDVYFISAERNLMRLRVSDLAAGPELAARDIDRFSPIDTARGALLLLERASAGSGDPPQRTIFDPTMSTEIPVPGATAPSFNVPAVLPSPTGRFLLVQNRSDDGAESTALYDRDTNTTQTQPDLHGAAIWRPAHDEVWLEADSNSGGSAVLRWLPGDVPVHVTDGGLEMSFDISKSIFAGAPFIEYTFERVPFTPDGEFWFSKEPEGFLAIRSVDDPASTLFAVNAVGTGVSGYVPLPDGRGISEVYSTYPFHCDISLVDPRQRTSSLLASTGYVVRVGAKRVLALLNWTKGSLSGDLTLIDIETGVQTLLAENVFAVAVEQLGGQIDHLPPGARVAYLVRNRIESPYDGLWVTTLP